MTKIKYADYFTAACHALSHICENVQTNSKKSRISRVECTNIYFKDTKTNTALIYIL